MKNEYFSDKSPLGEVIQMEEKEYIVIGVTGNFNIGIWVNQPSGYFIQSSLLNSTERPPANYLVQFKHPIDVTIYEIMDNVFAQLNKDEQYMLGDAAPLEVFQKLSRRNTLLPIIILSIVSGFLIINVVVGLFGILWQGINRRRTEIGLRRAVGAYSGNIYFQILCEVWILAALGIIPGIILMFQLPILGVFDGIRLGTYLMAMGVASLVIYILITVCALYPSKLAASIQPATALHEN
jgi:putative ABC transport system permease protein